jgi:4-hydroxybenzoate polyprenyltransferase
VVKYLKLARITAWPTSLFSFAVGFGAGATRLTDWADALFGFLAVFSFFGFAFALNFYSDRDVDRYHDGWLRDIKLSQQPLLTGEITVRECQVFCLFTFLLSIAFGWLAGGRLVALLIFGACLVGGILYSYPLIRLKSKPVGDILCMSCLSAVLFSAGYVVAWGEMPRWLMFLFFAIFSAIIYIPTVISDYEFDSRAGLKTSAVVFGQRNLLKATWVIWLCSLPVAWLLVSGTYPLGTKVCVVVACVASLIWTALAWTNLKPPLLDMPVLNRHSREAIIYFGVISLIFIGWGLFKLYS